MVNIKGNKFSLFWVWAIANISVLFFSGYYTVVHKKESGLNNLNPILKSYTIIIILL